MSYNTLNEWSLFASPQAFRIYASTDPATVQRCLDVASSFINSKLTGAFLRVQLPLENPPYVIKDCELKIAAWHLVGAMGLPVEGIELLEKMYLSAVDTISRLDDGRDSLSESDHHPNLIS